MANRIQDRVGAIAQRLFSGDALPEPPRTILVIDDEEGIRRFVERVLQGAGYTVVVAASGPDALRAAEGIEGLDLIVTDVMMPEMSGCELARRLRLQNPDLKVLYVTGYSDRLFEEKVAMWENEAFVEKPCSVKALLEGVSLLWSQHIEMPLALRHAN
jgi:two-component system cell cycle sensor histidine kinase/response regulator CckA